MSRITKEMWNKALQHLKEMKQLGLSIGFVGVFYVQGCNELERRYDNGERTKKLYDEIMNLH
jgi:hypothetical protein